MRPGEVEAFAGSAGIYPNETRQIGATAPLGFPLRSPAGVVRVFRSCPSLAPADTPGQ